MKPRDPKRCAVPGCAGSRVYSGLTFCPAHERAYKKAKVWYGESLTKQQYAKMVVP